MTAVSGAAKPGHQRCAVRQQRDAMADHCLETVSTPLAHHPQ
ncbi:hypothetical protein [Streptomyces roseolus]|nr:hypothetical protein [Streptomyces roseolus]